MWLFLHSGSRGVGNKIAQQHIKVAQRQCAQWWISLPDRDLAYLVEGTAEFGSYIRELRWAQQFALLNREEMMDRVVACFAEWVGADASIRARRSTATTTTRRRSATSARTCGCPARARSTPRDGRAAG